MPVIGVFLQRQIKNIDTQSRVGQKLLLKI